MGTVKDKDYKKPKLKKDDIVILVELVEGADVFQGKLTSVESFSDGKLKLKGVSSNLNETGMGDKKRAILLADDLLASWSNSAFLKDTAAIGKIILNKDMLFSMDMANEKKA